MNDNDLSRVEQLATRFPRAPRWLLFAWVMLGCSRAFVPSTTPAGTPNLEQYAPGLWRMGEPPGGAAWEELRALIAPREQHVTVVKLNDEAEGSDDYAEKTLGWTVVRVPLPPEDDKPWTVFVMPRPEDVARALQAIADGQARGDVVVHHCTHGRDRTSLIAALELGKLNGWSKDRVWKDMISHGFRWELPDLDVYFATYVR